MLRRVHTTTRGGGQVITITGMVIVMAMVMVMAVYAAEPKRVRLTDVETITLVADRFTTGRRSAGVPQLKCVEGPCHQWRPTTVQCRNQGSDGVDVQWKCEANDMPASLKFGAIEVVCEGYAYPDDPYILGGSCGLEYSLASTGINDHSNQHNYQYQQQDYNNNYRPPTYHTPSSNGGSSIVPLVIFAFIAFIIYRCCQGSGGANGGGGGGGAPYGGDQPGAPPPSSGWGSGNSGYSSYSGSHYGTSAPSSSNSGPGFWSGMAAGGAMGYMAGRRNTPSHTTYSAPSSSSWGSSGSSFGGGSSSSSASAPRTATAFGGTRRR